MTCRKFEDKWRKVLPAAFNRVKVIFAETSEKKFLLVSLSIFVYTFVVD